MVDPPSGHRTTIFRENGLIAVFAITLAYVAVVFLVPGSPVRVPLGLVELLFAPGYALGAILFVRRPLLPPAAEFSVSVGLSVVFNVLVGLLLATIGTGLAIVWLVAADTVVVWLGLVVMVVWGDAPGVTGVPAAIRRELRLPGVRPSYRKAAYALIVATLVAFGGVVYLGIAQPPTAASTYLALSGWGGTSATLPNNLTVGEVASVVLNIGDGYSSGPIEVVATATILGQNSTISHPEPWNLPLAFSPGNTSSMPLALGYGEQTTLNVTFYFTQVAHFVLTFSLEAVGGASLQAVPLSVVVL